MPVRPPAPRPRRAAALAAAALLLPACGGDDEEPAPPPLDVPLAAPCEAVDDRQVEDVLRGPVQASAELGPDQTYPEGLTGYEPGAPAGRYVCVYQAEGGAEVSLAVGPPDRNAFAGGRTAPGCGYDSDAPFPGDAYVLRCASPTEPPFVAYVLLTPSSLVQCLGSGPLGDLDAVEPQVERLCRDAVEQLGA